VSRFTDDQDLFDDMPIGGDHPVPEPTPKAPEPKLSKEQKARKTSAAIGVATKKRRRWEAGPEGQARTKDIQDLATEHHNRDLAARGLPTIGRTTLSRAQLYGAMGVTNEGHGHGDQQLPGFENPHSAPTPPRWEELSPKQQGQVHEKLRLQGTSLGQMKEDFGAQLDQSIYRAHLAGHRRASTGEPTPFTAHFYGEHPDDAPEPLDRPKEMMRESRAHLASQGIHVDPSVHTAAIGHVSPNVKFTQGERGNRSSPNIEAAESVFQQHDAGISSKSVTQGVNRQGVTNQSRPKNSVRAARMIEHVAGGGTLGTARNAPSASSPQGSSQWGPKTGPFANSFDASTPDYLVADVHTGGGGMLPHLGTTKGIRVNANGTKARLAMFRNDPRSDEELLRTHRPRDVFYPGKSEREKGIESGGVGAGAPFHVAADYAARQAVAERGLGTSVRRPQASQWGDEQVQRKAANPKLDVPSHAEAYPSQRPVVSDSQFKLF
jgi:hypothetical protein